MKKVQVCCEAGVEKTPPPPHPMGYRDQNGLGGYRISFSRQCISTSVIARETIGCVPRSSQFQTPTVEVRGGVGGGGVK